MLYRYGVYRLFTKRRSVAKFMILSALCGYTRCTVSCVKPDSTAIRTLESEQPGKREVQGRIERLNAGLKDVFPRPCGEYVLSEIKREDGSTYFYETFDPKGEYVVDRSIKPVAWKGNQLVWKSRGCPENPQSSSPAPSIFKPNNPWSYDPATNSYRRMPWPGRAK